MSDGLSEVLGRALLEHTRHCWATKVPFEQDWERLGPHYVHDAERFFAPAVRAHLAALAQDERVREQVAEAVFNRDRCPHEAVAEGKYPVATVCARCDADAAVAAFLAATDPTP